MEKKQAYFTALERWLWGVSVTFITAAFILFDRAGYLTLLASLIGTTSLIFCAKGNPIGQVLMIAFSLLYGYISYGFAYYGEMLTYLGMTAPMAVLALCSWLRHPYKGRKSEVTVNKLSAKELAFALVLTAAVTAVFYFVLKALGTANLLPSTVSVATSFLAVYLTYRRSPWFALGYAANDAVLIVLWVMASREDRAYISVAVCFVAFLVNDLYGFISWRRMQRRQASGD